MPFGKYRGVELEDLPNDYLEWLGEQGWLREPLASAVEAELDARGGEPPPTRTQDIPADMKVIARDIIRHGYRALAKHYHPDHGGSHQDMVKLTHARDWLQERIE
jgi:Putative quorum-sensing-regulated virulence factor